MSWAETGGCFVTHVDCLKLHNLAHILQSLYASQMSLV